MKTFNKHRAVLQGCTGEPGLGLAIVKQLVEAQDGSINVKSKIDEGSTFGFILSFQKTKAEAESDADVLELDTEM